MTRREEFQRRDPIFLSRSPEILAEEETIARQQCAKFDCRGNVDGRCGYVPKIFENCRDRYSFKKFDNVTGKTLYFCLS